MYDLKYMTLVNDKMLSRLTILSRVLELLHERGKKKLNNQTMTEFTFPDIRQ